MCLFNSLRTGGLLGLSAVLLESLQCHHHALSSSFAFFSEVLCGTLNTLMINSNQTQILQMKMACSTYYRNI